MASQGAALAEFCLSFALLLAYAGWHAYLKFVKRASVGAVVFIAASVMFFQSCSALSVFSGLLSSSPGPLSVWIGFAIIVCFLLLCLPLLLLARGLFVLAPSLSGLSDAAKVHMQQLLALSFVLAVAALLFCLPLPERVVFSLQIAAAPLLILFVGFFGIRLVQAVKATNKKKEKPPVSFAPLTVLRLSISGHSRGGGDAVHGAAAAALFV
jgi:hypothetical protein